MPKRPYRSAVRDAAVEETRARILAAARKVLASGTRPFTIDEVASKARVARITVFDRFGNKGGLFEALFDDFAMKSPLTRMPEVFAAPDLGQAIDRMIVLFCEFWASDRQFARRMRILASVDPEMEHALQMREERRRVLLRALVERSPPARVDVEDIVDLLFMLTSFETYDSLARSRSADAIARLLQGLAASVLRGPD